MSEAFDKALREYESRNQAVQQGTVAKSQDPHGYEEWSEIVRPPEDETPDTDMLPVYDTASTIDYRGASNIDQALPGAPPEADSGETSEGVPATDAPTPTPEADDGPPRTADRPPESPPMGTAAGGPYPEEEEAMARIAQKAIDTEPYTRPEELVNDEKWMNAVDQIIGADFEGTDEEKSKELRWVLNNFNWNTIGALGWGYEALTGTPEYAQAWLDALEVSEKTGWDGDNARWAVSNILMDPATYAGGSLYTWGARQAARQSVKKGLMAVATGGFIEGAALMGALETGEQGMEIGAGEREEYGQTEIALAAGTGGAINAAAATLLTAPVFMAGGRNAARAARDRVRSHAQEDVLDTIETVGGEVLHDGKRWTVDAYNQPWVKLVDEQGNTKNVYRKSLTRAPDQQVAIHTKPLEGELIPGEKPLGKEDQALLDKHLAGSRAEQAERESAEAAAKEAWDKSEDVGHDIPSMVDDVISRNLANAGKVWQDRVGLAEASTPEGEIVRNAVMRLTGMEPSPRWPTKNLQSLQTMYNQSVVVMQQGAMQIMDIFKVTGRIDPVDMARYGLERMRLRAVRELVENGPGGSYKRFRNLVQNYNRTIDQPEAQAQVLRQIIDSMGGPRVLKADMKYMSSVGKPSWRVFRAERYKSAWLNALGSGFVQMRYNFMLSDVSTQLANVIGNTSVAVLEGLALHPARVGFNYAEYYWRATFGKPMLEAERIRFLTWGDKKASARAAIEDMFRVIPPIWKGDVIPKTHLQVGGKISQELGIRYNPTQLLQPESTGGKVAYTAMSAPIRALETMDTMFKSWHFHRKMYELADQKARGRVQTGGKKDKLLPEDMSYADRMEYWIKNPDEGMIQAANKEGARKTFTNDVTDVYGSFIGTFAEMMATAQHSHPIMQALIPFVKTPANLFGYALDHSLIGTALSPKRTMINEFLHGTPEQRASFVARTTISAGIGMLAWELYENGQITGQGSDNYAVARAREKLGIYPNSALIGGEYYVMDRLDPVGLVLNLWATTFDSFKHAEDPDAKLAIMTNAMLENSQMLMDRSWLNTFTDTMAAIKEGGVKQGASILASTIGTFLVPNIVRGARRGDDPATREMSIDTEQGIMEATKDRFMMQTMNAIPGLSKDLPAKILWDGSYDIKDGGMLWNQLVPIRVKEEKNDPASIALWNAQVDISKPAASISLSASPLAPLSINLRAMDEYGHVYQQYQMMVGKARKELMDDFVAPGGKYEELIAESREKYPDDPGHDLGPNGMASVIMQKMIGAGSQIGRGRFLEWVIGRTEFDIDDGTRTIQITNPIYEDEFGDIIRDLVDQETSAIEIREETPQFKSRQRKTAPDPEQLKQAFPTF